MVVFCIFFKEIKNLAKQLSTDFKVKEQMLFKKVRLKSLKNLLLNRPRFMRAVIELLAQMDRCFDHWSAGWMVKKKNC
ncbi:hypothetical protein T4B_15371 [Trichinella pseudospiralis]|uniref:Uncharacterized protein n=1 Tax=Trichinella pseudospiralis TaxID=6337 RepID=A0A0V1IJD5_TRIPS|nr:hypothetical protein T4B_15371 [Trichinella pseudospiralis]